MATEVGSGYISLVPSAKGFGPAVATLISGPVETAATQSGATAGKSLQTSLLGSVQGTSGKLLGALGFASIGVAAFKSATDVESAQNIILRSTGATGKAADSLLASFQRVGSETPASLDTVASTLATLAQRTGIYGKGLEDLTLQVVTFNRITKDSPLDVQSLTQALAGFNVPGAQMGKTLDQLFTTSQKTGVPLATLIDTLNTAGPVARQFGFSVSFTAGLLAQLNKAGVDTNSIMPGLRKAFIQFAKDGREPAAALRETLGEMDALIKKGDEVGARQIAVQLFGARGAGLVDAAIQGKLSLQSLSETFDTTGKGILATASTTGTLSGKLGILKNQAILAFASFGTPILKEATSDLAAIVPITAVLGAGLGHIAPLLGPIVLGFGAFKLATIVLPPLLRLVSTGLFEVAVGMETVGAEGAASGLGNFAGGLQGLSSKLPAAAGGLAVVALGATQAGKSGTQGALGIGEMAAGGALLGSVIPGVGTVLGGLAGAVVGLSIHMLSGGESVEAYRKHFLDLADAIDLVGSKQAAKKFIDQLGDTDKLALFGHNVSGIKDELQTLATKSPDAANKVVAGLKAMHDESGKPFFSSAEIQTFDAFIDQAITKTKNATQHKKEADAANQKLTGSENTLQGAMNGVSGAADQEAARLGDLQSVVLGNVDAHAAFEQATNNVAKAYVSLLDAQNQFGVDSPQAAEAAANLKDAQNQAAGATLTLDQATAKLHATYKDSASVDQAIADLQKQQQEYPATADTLNPLIFQLLQLKAEYDQIPATVDTTVTANTTDAQTKLAALLTTTLSLMGLFSGKSTAEVFAGVSPGALALKTSAGGNFLRAGEPSIVGEKGPELWWPDTAGRVIPQSQMASKMTAMVAPANRSDGITVEKVEYHGPLDDPARRTRMIADDLRSAAHLVNL